MKYDVTAIGRPYTDILANVSESFVASLNAPKGIGRFITEDEFYSIKKQLRNIIYMPGGCAANSLSCLAALGGKGNFIGKLCDDEIGLMFCQAFQKNGVDFHINPLVHKKGLLSPCTLILNTPDLERTILWNHGVANHLSKQELEESFIQESKVFLIEVPVLKAEHIAENVFNMISQLKNSETKIAINIQGFESNHKVLQKYKTNILKQSDILFGNEQEVLDFFEIDTYEKGIDVLQKQESIICLTRGAKGVAVFNNSNFEEVPAKSVENIVDTVGAGDYFAGGFLWGITQGLTCKASAEVGVECASRIIQQAGGRLEVC